MEGWDAVSFFQQDPARAVLGGGAAPPSGSLFAIENLSSRRGRADDSAKYWPLPNELADAPFQAGGNPAQAALAADYGHVVALEAAWAALLAPHGLLPGAVLVDFCESGNPFLLACRFPPLLFRLCWLPPRNSHVCWLTPRSPAFARPPCMCPPS